MAGGNFLSGLGKSLKSSLKSGLATVVGGLAGYGADWAVTQLVPKGQQQLQGLSDQDRAALLAAYKGQGGPGGNLLASSLKLDDPKTLLVIAGGVLGLILVLTRGR